MSFRQLEINITQLRQEHAQTRGMVVSIIHVLQRGFLGRLKWLFLGR